MGGECCGIIKESVKVLDREDIKKILPHRGDALIITEARWPEENPNEIRSILTPADHYFEGHFPGQPVFPGHWLNEAVNLAAAVLAYLVAPEMKGSLPIIATESGIMYKRPVKKGDTVEIRVVLKKKNVSRRSTTFSFFAEVTNQQGKPVASYEDITGAAVNPADI